MLYPGAAGLTPFRGWLATRRHLEIPPGKAGARGAGR
jgi:hypothetical protein